MGDMIELSSEDAKLLTLARGARARTGAAEGAAVRDAEGRTYAATTVSLASLRLSALQAAVAAAVSSGAAGLEAAAVVGGEEVAQPDDLAVVLEFGGAGTPVVLADAAGRIVSTVLVAEGADSDK
jgi:cytidine deaminase